MRAYLLLASIVLGGVVGCASPRQGLGVPPNPILSTRAPKPVHAVPPPAPRTYRAPSTPRPRVTKATPAPPRTRRIGSGTVVIDPGHGGKDPGALGVGPMHEKAVNLGVGLKLKQRLERAGANVVCSRTTDRFPTLNARAALAERSKADLFVSIHADACGKPSVTGATIYIARNASRRSQQAARDIQSAMERAGIKVRGIRKAGFRVLVGHSRPAVLVECGYLTNAGEARRLASPSYQATLASAIAEGIADYLAR